VPFAPLLTCALTFGLALGSWAQTPNVIVTGPQNPIIEGTTGGQVNADFQVSLSSAATANTTVTLAPQSVSATADEDFVSTPQTITFPTGTLGPITVSVPVLGDETDEPDETFNLVATAADNATRNNATGTATIQDDDALPTLSIADPIAAATEGNSGTSNLNFTVSLSGPSSQTVTFQYVAVADPDAGPDSATPGQDFTSETLTGSIAAGQTETTITIPIIGDLVDEATETFVVNISNVQGATLANSQGRGTINDDDGPTIRINDVSQNEGEDFSFTVTLSAASPETISVNYTTVDNSARAGQDYTATVGTLNFLPGETAIDVTVPTIDDALAENTEIFTVNLSGTSAGVTFADQQGLGTIFDNEDAPVITIAPQSAIEGNLGASDNRITFTATLSTASAQTVSFRYATSSGTAVANRDFRSSSQTLTFAPGTTTRSFNIAIIPDNIDEVNETFNVTLSSASNATFANSVNTVTTTGTIIDDDGPTITFADRTIEVVEGGTGSVRNMTFTVRLSAASENPITVRFATSRGAVEPATAGADFRATSGTLTFAAGETSKVISVQILGDATDEPDETFNVVLSSPTGGTIPTEQSTATGTIRDDDATPIVSISNVSANEGSNGRTSSFSFIVSLDRASARTVSVDYATTGVTATPDVDFTTNSGTVTFNPGVTRQTIVVRVTGDNLDEPTETFRVTLDSASVQNAQAPSSTRVGLGTIRDDDDTPQLSLETSPLTIAEGGTGTGTGTGGTPATVKLTFNATLSAPSGQDVSFNFQTVQATSNRGDLRPATQGSDFATTNGRLTIPAGQTSAIIEVTINGDALDEFNEYFNVVISGAINARIRNATGIGVITDDDAAGTISVDAPAADRSAIEGGRVATFPVTLSAASGRDVTIFFSISGDGENNQATPRLDLAPINETTGVTRVGETTGSITIPAGQTKSNIIVVGLSDTIDEPTTENFRVAVTSISPSDYVTADGKNSAASTVEDRDPGFARFTPGDGFQNYGRSGGFQGNGTDVVITGNQFRINNVSQIREIRFGVIGNDVRSGVVATTFRVESDTSVRVRVPDNARSGRIRIVTIDGTVLSPSDDDADDIFYVNAVVTGFTPDRGVPRNTVVVITGINFNDPLNPVTGVRFGTVASTERTAGTDPVVFTENGQSKIRATVPTGAASGPITIVTDNGTNYPPSVDSFTVDNGTAGGIRWTETPTFVVPENSRGNASTPIATYQLELDPAIQGDPAQSEILPRGDVTVRVSIVDDPNVRRVRLPEILTTGGRVRRISGQTFEIVFEAGTFQTKTISLIDAGDDLNGPVFVSGGFFQEQTTRKLTLSATIVRSNDTQFYPINARASDITIERADLHGLDTDIGTTLRTTEDQDSRANITEFKLNLRNINNGVDVAADGKPVTTRRYSNRPQPTVLNPDGTVNRDAEPTSDVFLPFRVTDPGEALIRYYVRIPDGRGGFTKVYPNEGGTGAGDAVFRPTVTVIYATDPSRAEYYKYDHYIEVRGVDDNEQDGAQSYQILLDNDEGSPQNPNSNSTDPEFFKLNLVTPFTLSNSDNEQSTGSGEPGFIFSRSSGDPSVPRLTTSEAGGQDFFTVRLRTRPTTGKVTLRLQSGDPSEVLFFTDATRSRTTETLDLQFFADSQPRWDTPQTVRIVGVNDENIDDAQIVNLLTSTVDSATDDPAYRTIDPVDPIVTNQPAQGISVSPTNLVVDEGGTETFTVRLNARPNTNVTINLASADPSIATVSTNRLVFTPDNWNTPQVVTVRGVSDRVFTRRTTTIVTSAASSSDVAFNNFDVPDVQVAVENVTTVFTVSPTTATTTGLSTSEDGLSDTFSVRLANAPTSSVVLNLNSGSDEILISAPGQARSSSIQLTFTPQNFSLAQTVTVVGQDDEATDGAQSFDITGFITSDDPTFSGQSFPTIVGTNADNDGASTGGSITFAANGTYTVSFPYATSDGTLTKAQAFSSASGLSTSNFTLYKFNVTGQRNSRASNGGTDFVVVGDNEKLVRGIGYRLVTNSEAIRLNTPSEVSALRAFSGTSFTYNLNWNRNFLTETSSTDNRFNGYNLIGFPFDPTRFSRVSFANAKVQYGNDIYESVSDAAAAGIIGRQLLTVDAQGNLSEATASDLQLRPYRAYFVRIFRNEFPVVLTLRNPTN
jgi:hypothetical protein